MILVTVVVQGLSLPALVRRLGVVDPNRAADEEREARLVAHRAVLTFLNSEGTPDGVPPEQVARLRSFYEKRIRHADAHAEAAASGDAATGDDREPVAVYHQLKRTLLAVQRRAVRALHDEGHLGDDGLRRVERTLDLEEAQL